MWPVICPSPFPLLTSPSSSLILSHQFSLPFCHSFSLPSVLPPPSSPFLPPLCLLHLPPLLFSSLPLCLLHLSPFLSHFLPNPLLSFSQDRKNHVQSRYDKVRADGERIHALVKENLDYFQVLDCAYMVSVSMAWMQHIRLNIRSNPRTLLLRSACIWH